MIVIFSETCKDVAPTGLCITIKNRMQDGCLKYPQSCWLNCGQCKPCAILKSELKCTAGMQICIFSRLF